MNLFYDFACVYLRMCVRAHVCTHTHTHTHDNGKQGLTYLMPHASFSSAKFLNN